MQLKKEVLKEQVQDICKIYSKNIDKILEPKTDCKGYQTYTAVKNELIVETIRLRVMLNEDTKKILEAREFSPELLSECSRSIDQIADMVLEGDDLQVKKAALESYLMPKEILQEFYSETNDLGIDMQKLTVRTLIEKLVNLSEACKKKKKKR